MLKMQKRDKKDDSSGVRSEFWGICCEGGKRYSQIVCKKFHISMAALDPTDTMTSPCVSLMVERDGCQYLLCSLKPDSVLQVILNLYFDKGEDITFFLKGHGTVHLSGYYICDESDASNTDNPKKGGANALTKKFDKKPQTSFTVSEDVEVESSDDDDDDEESSVEELPVKGKQISPIKKAIAPSSMNSKKNNLNQKVLSKKDDTSEEESSDEDDSEDEDTGKDGELLKAYAAKRVHSTIESEEESSDEDDDSEEEELPKLGNLKQPQNKKLKAEAATPVQNKSVLKTPKSTNFLGVSKTPDLDSSIGRTPMPKKSLPVMQKTSPIDSFLAKMKNQSKSPKQDSSDSDEMETSATKSPQKPLPNNQLNTSAQGESAKKKKKKRKSKAAANESQESVGKSPAKPQFGHKLPSGVEYEDVRMGNGLPAKKGKLVHVYYTGKLANDKVFDSCKQGTKPFSFKLAAGQVIKGWDLGIEGMKVGGKRRLKIPPSMGYANQKTGSIPPNSTLYFDVELKAVS